MYSITKAGLPLLRGLQSIAASTPNAVLRETLGSVIDHLQGGRELSFAFGTFPDVFSKFYVSVIKVGESSGTLETAFPAHVRIPRHGEANPGQGQSGAALSGYRRSRRSRIAVTIITMWVLPKFAPIFAALGDNLPWATRVLIGTSTFVSTYWYIVVALIVAAVIGLQALHPRSRGPLSLGQVQARRADRRRYHRAARRLRRSAGRSR